MKLYSYWRSTTSYRVRAALNLKGLDCAVVPVDLVAGDQRAAEYQRLNPGKVVPTLALDDGQVLTQSLAILDYLDSKWPNPRLIPDNPLARAKVLAAAQVVALDIHPVNNLRVIGELKARFGADADQCRDWMQHWMAEGFDTVAALVDPDTRFAFGDDAPDLADICIAAQVYNSRRWGLTLDRWPRIAAIETACLDIAAIRAAHPDEQPETKVV